MEGPAAQRRPTQCGDTAETQIIIAQCELEEHWNNQHYALQDST
jgi:hypothetical protein